VLFAQSSDGLEYPVSKQVLPVATINQEKLFSNSLYGKSFNEKLQDDANILSLENRRIEKELSDEEISLTQKRKELPNEDFRKLADIFNKKVESIRRDQSLKSAELNAANTQIRKRFFIQAQPIIVQLMQERGIQFILNEQSIFMSANSGDITQAAVERIDQVLIVPDFNNQN
jgi:Skp family chaperone for outer membrane proteins